MYLWKREGGFTFQQRIPVSVESQLGKSPIRVNLGPLPAAVARKRAIILSGAAMQLMDDPTMTRETLVHSLRALNAELQALNQKNFALPALIVKAHQEADEVEAEGAESYARTLREKAQRLSIEKAGIPDFRKRLESIADALSKDSIAWESERETFQSVVRTLGSLGAPVQLPQVQREQQVQPPEPPPTEYRDARTVTASTKFSVAGRIILDARKDALDKGNKDKVHYEERLENTFAAFLNVVGDHPLSYYLPIHLQDFATVMAKVPTNRAKYPIFAGLNLKQMGAKNDKLPDEKRIKSLSQTTVKEHVAQIKLI